MYLALKSRVCQLFDSCCEMESIANIQNRWSLKLMMREDRECWKADFLTRYPENCWQLD